MRELMLLLIVAPGLSLADDVLMFQSEPGDYIGQGQMQTLTYAPGQVTIGNFGSGVMIAPPLSASPHWHLILAPPQNGSFAAACYERTVRANFDSPQQPELDFSNASRGCSQSIGRYKILEYVAGAPGQPPSVLAVDFVQHCSANGGPALYGKIRFNSSVPTTENYLDPAIAVSGQLSYDAEAGAVGGGAGAVSRTIPFTALQLHASRNFDNGVSLRFSGDIAGVGSNAFWSLDFAGPDNAPIASGSYANAQAYPSQTSGFPGLDFSFNGSACGTVFGDFDVTAASYDVLSGSPLSFHAAFDQHCDSASGPLSSGTIAYDAAFVNAPVDPDLIFVDGFSGPVVNTVWSCP